MSTNQASVVWKHLNGVICVYKPNGFSWGRCLQSLQGRIVSDLNQMQCREPHDYVKMAGNTSKSIEVTVDTNYADHPLVVGPRYLPEDVSCLPLKRLGIRTSGVCLAGINDGIRGLSKLVLHNPISTLHVVGEFGMCTDNKAIDGNILYTSNYRHLRKTKIDKVVSTIQSIHRKHLLKQCGYHPHSQRAYDLLASGKLRPLGSNIPVIYSIKCIDWKPPQFTLEIVVVNEEEDYLLSLIDEIGLRARNLAVGCSIRCLRTSMFSVEDALLEKHWNVQNILENMDVCRRKLESVEEVTQFFNPINFNHKDSLSENAGDDSEEI